MWRTTETPAVGEKIEAEPGSCAPITLLLNTVSGGGAQRRIATLANRFVELGREVDVVSFDKDGPMRGLLAPEVHVVSLVGGTAVERLRAYLESVAPSVLMSCVTDTHATAAHAARATRVPLVLRASRHPHRALPRWNLPRRIAEPIKLRRAAGIYAQADAIVALSADGASALQRLLGDRPARIETILNPVVDRVLLDTEERKRARTGDVSLILGIGRLVKQKDFATLLRAFALLRAERPARLVLLGEGPERRRLQALADRLGVAGQVEMPGEVNDVAEWLGRADLLVSSSRWEGMQAVPIEALAAGCPVVATDCPGGAHEALDGGRLGSLVPVQNPDAMARAMRDQLDHPPDPHMLAAGAARFLPYGKAEQYLRLFDSLRRD
jgi:glycosyltransferase involved in cell wall biosynthesis